MTKYRRDLVPARPLAICQRRAFSSTDFSRYLSMPLEREDPDVTMHTDASPQPGQYVNFQPES